MKKLRKLTRTRYEMCADVLLATNRQLRRTNAHVCYEYLTHLIPDDAVVFFSQPCSSNNNRERERKKINQTHRYGSAVM